MRTVGWADLFSGKLEQYEVFALRFDQTLDEIDEAIPPPEKSLDLILSQERFDSLPHHFPIQRIQPFPEQTVAVAQPLRISELVEVVEGPRVIDQPDIPELVDQGVAEVPVFVENQQIECEPLLSLMRPAETNQPRGASPLSLHSRSRLEVCLCGH